MKPGPQKRMRFKRQGHDAAIPNAHRECRNMGKTPSYGFDRSESAFRADATPLHIPASGRSWFPTVESARKVVDIREQFPMLLRQEIALAPGISHPVYIHSRLRTPDVLVARVRNVQRTLVASELEDDNNALPHSSRKGASA